MWRDGLSEIIGWMDGWTASFFRGFVVGKVMDKSVDKITDTTAFSIPVVEQRLYREIAQYVHMAKTWLISW